MDTNIDLNAAVRRFAALSGVAPRERPDGKYQGACPLCEPQDPSGHHLYVEPGDKQPFVYHCQRGCDQQELTELFWSEGFGNGSRPPRDEKPTRRRVATHDYPKADGSPNLRVERWHTTDPARLKGYRKDCYLSHWDGGQWVNGQGDGERVLYGLPAILAQPGARVLWVEGENKVDALRERGILGTCALGGCGQKGKLPDLSSLSGRDVALLADHDADGSAYAETVLPALTQAGARAFEVPSLPSEAAKPAGYDVVDWFDEGHTAAELAALVESARSGAGVTVADEWPEPAPLDAIELPEFPLDALEPWIANMVEATATAMQVPLDLPGLLSFAVLGTAFQRRVEAVVREGWSEPLSIYAAAAASSGERKSPVYEQMIGPLVDYEASMIRDTLGSVLAAQNTRKVLEAALDRKQKEAARAALDTERKALIEEANVLARELDGLTGDVSPQFFADEISSERMGMLLAQQHGRMAIMSDEGDIFDMMAGRYQNNSPNIGVYLKAHSGGEVRVDRVGRPAVSVPRAAISIGVAVQPDVLLGMTTNATFKGRGLLARFIYAMPRSSVGFRKSRASPIPRSVAEIYATRLKQCLQIPAASPKGGRDVPHRLLFSPDADDAVAAFEDWLEPRLQPGGGMGTMEGWAGKLVGQMVRITASQHLSCLAGTPKPWAIPVEGDRVQRAVRIAQYLIPHAQAAFLAMGSDPAVKGARIILGWVRKRHEEQFSREELRVSLRSQFARTEDLDAPLKVLLEHGYLRQVGAPPKEGAGRPPAPQFRCHPSLLAE